MTDNSSTGALRDAIRWQELVARTGQTKEQRDRAAARVVKLTALVAEREAAASCHTSR